MIRLHRRVRALLFKFYWFRTSFFVFFFVFCVGLLPGVFLANLDATKLGPVDVGFASVGSFFIACFRSLLWLYLFPLVLTPSLFGPFLCAVSSFLMGLKCGYLGMVLFHLANGLSLLLLFVFLFLRAFVYLLVPAFCSCVSFALFEPAANENKMFGGSLFNAPFYSDTLNIRFLFSFVLIWFLLLLLQVPISLFGAYLLNSCFA